MLLQFKFSNFRCYADENTFDMTATSIKEHKSSLIERNAVNILPVAAIYGANASGKTSFFMAFERMQSVVINKLIAYETFSELKSKNFSVPFLFDSKTQDQKTEYEVSILIDNNEYRYGFSCTKDRILDEYLYKKKFSKNHTIEKIIFERQESTVTTGEKINMKLKKEISYCASMITEKSLILTDIGLRKNDNVVCQVFSWFCNTNVLSNDTQKLFSSSDTVEMFIGNMLAKNNIDPDFTEQYKHLIREVDPCIKDIVYIEEKDSDGNNVYIAKTVHNFEGKSELVPLKNESEGTIKFIFLILFILLALKKGALFFVDEIDSQLHPLILRKIVQLFTNKKTNPLGSQLIFSAHNLINLDSSDLRRDEIWFVEKNNHSSYMYSLVDFDDGGIRSDLSYGKHYLSGRFGAVPFQDKE